MSPSSSGTLVTFDYEGKWGMPYGEKYDLRGATNKILDILRSNEVHAMFFIVGRLIQEEPNLVARIANEGHAIGLHGYGHERLDTLSLSQLGALQSDLESVCRLVERLTGSRPIAFRAPYLLWPKFFDPSVSAMLVDLGFLWMSNRHIRYAEELFLPSRMPWASLRRVAEHLGLLSDRRLLGALMLAALNARELTKDPDLGSRFRLLQWLLGGRPPFERSGLIEVAISSPLECDLLGLPLPTEYTDNELLNFATACLIKGKQRRANPYMVTFHDWIIGTGNRPILLSNVLSALRNNGPMLDARSWAPHVRVGRA